MNTLLKNKLDNLPERPGVYLMRSADNTVIYVGKAKILKNRVKQYFQSQTNQPIKVRKMVEHISDIDYIITDTEVEALMLECNLIKQYRPYYNIMMKDDKSYPYLKLTLGDDYPKLEFTRKRKFDDGKYFGPYVNAYAARQTMNALRLFYPLKMCNKKTTFGSKIGNVCLNYHIGQCAGVCQGTIDPTVYAGYIDEIDEILSKGTDPLIRKLEEEMYKESDLLHFEAAGTIKEYIEAIKNLDQKQKMSDASTDDRDIIALASDEKNACIQLFIIRNGKIIRTATKYMRTDSDESAEILSSFIKQYYTSGSHIPHEIIVQEMPEDNKTIEEMLSDLKGRKVVLKVPQRGNKKRLLELAQKNAQMNIDIKKSKEERKARDKKRALAELAEVLHSEIVPFRIEAYDISNIAGSNNVGVMVVYENASRVPSLLRRFKIKTIEGQNDIGSMQEVVLRRLQRAKDEIETQTDSPKFLPLPELIFVDGGLGHVHAIKEIMDRFAYPINVAGLVKDNKHNLRGIITEDGSEISITDFQAAKQLLNDISTQVHRAAIGYHQTSRSAAMLRTELETIDGVGKKRIAQLFKHFRSLNNIKKASVQELASVDGMNITAAENIYTYYHDQKNQS